MSISRIILFMFFILLSSTGVNCIAQTQKIPLITLGRVPRPDIKNGKLIPTPTTRQQILKNALLIADVNNCRVTEYKCSIIAYGRPFYGPIYVNGPDLTDGLKNKIKELDGPNVKVYIEDIKMNYRGTIMDAAPIAMVYDN